MHQSCPHSLRMVEIKRDIDGLLGAKQFDGSGIDPVSFAKLLGLNPRVTGFLDYGTGGFTTQYAAMLIASGMMYLRLAVLIALFNRNLIAMLAAPFVVVPCQGSEGSGNDLS